MRKSRLVFSLVAILTGVGFAATGHAADEPIVIDDLTLPQLRAEIEKIQGEFYRVFNAANDDDDFDIICHDFTATGTNIPERACEPQFMIQRRAQNAKDYQDGFDELLSQAALLAELQPSFALLTEKLNAVASDSQYFRELRQILQMLQERLAELQ